jgi:hypothetical protein
MPENGSLILSQCWSLTNNQTQPMLVADQQANSANVGSGFNRRSIQVLNRKISGGAYMKNHIKKFVLLFISYNFSK